MIALFIESSLNRFMITIGVCAKIKLLENLGSGVAHH